MKPAKRLYVYEETAQEVIKWGEQAIINMEIQGYPRGKFGFPFYLEQYINYLKDLARIKRENEK